MNIQNVKFNLKKIRPSRHDFSHHKTFGASVVPLPQTLLFTTDILEQVGEECTAYSAVAIRAWEKKMKYDPTAFWNAELSIGATSNGSDLNTQGAVARKIGFVKVGESTPTDVISAMFYVNKKYGEDYFDTLRNVMNQMQVPLCVGLDWYEDWTAAPNAIIPHTQNQLLGGHAIKINGFCTLNGIDYLVLQNSWGTEHGNNGLYYMDRYMANKCLGQYGCTYWLDTANIQIQRLGLLQALLQNLYNLYVRLNPFGL